ncbi:DUF3299 domain-containing protein [Falsihalocynthiibacter sp. SS001]|uniref:DUF3299 domain-containing protein n=1 Tax=Falsihalocynthiibacter sp. SS001 TaxID=3349698 RepID=UPI0036D23A3F
MLNRRAALMLFSGSIVAPKMAFAAQPLEIMWEDLIPPGLPYPEIIGEGEMDEASDMWNPIYDANGEKMNEELNGAYVKLPGFIIPFDTSSEGVTNFMLVPYVGACIHTPPPPANQLVMVDTVKPWPGDELWDPVWVIGTMSTKLQSTTIAEVGYSMVADEIEVYEW